jgi:16S rRNA (guanine(527)-N(7))-methyltransferase RsmG
MIKRDAELGKILKALSLNIDDSVIEIIEEYLELLFKWHEQNNIISTRDRTYFLQRDFFDSLSMLSRLPKGPLLDIGTGAGIPGILLSFFRPDEHITLLDRRDNPIRFLEHVKLILKLENIDIVKTDINKMIITESPSAIIFKNFSNKVVSKLSFEAKLAYIVNMVRNNLGATSKIFLLTGSNVLTLKDDMNKHCDSLNAKIAITKIETPYFDTNRYILEIT